MNVVELHYTVDEVCLLLRLHRETVIKRMRAGEFGTEVANLGSEQRPDYRIPSSAIKSHLAEHFIFTEPGIAARSLGELRRKART